jgi:hypothetical protein
MIFLQYLACFFAGLFVCNGIPHLTCGLRGEPFPSPFSKPPGRGLSSALVNFFWGTVNLLVGAILLWLGSFTPGPNVGSACFAVAFILMGIPTSRHFEKVRLARRKDETGD